MKLFITTLLLMSFPLLGLAQGSHVGGGDATASDLQYFINQLDSYLLTNEGKVAFPEIKQPEFHNIIKTVKPVVKNERVYDGFGVNQTCISIVGSGKRTIQCDLKRLPSNVLNNHPTLYRLVFHELLFQAGLEVPISHDVPSDFRISSRLKLHLSNSREWLPGDGNNRISEECVALSEFEVLRTSVVKEALIENAKLRYEAFANRDSKLEELAITKTNNINHLVNQLAVQSCSKI